MSLTPADLDDLIAAERLPSAFRTAALTLYEPIAALIASRADQLARPLLVGLTGPQGSGKSTGAMVLQRLLAARGLNTAALSLDDFYLPRTERLALAERVHPLLAVRGPPGTHDVALAERVVSALLAGRTLHAPRFDKAADDRRPSAQWPLIEGPAKVVLLEGWCVGARPQDPAALAKPVNALERDEDPNGAWRQFVNAALAAYQPLFARIDLLIQLRPPSFDVVAGWRREQEAKLRVRAASGASDAGRVMTDADVDRFVQHYERLTRHMMAEMPARADVVVDLDAARAPVGTAWRAP